MPKLSKIFIVILTLFVVSLFFSSQVLAKIPTDVCCTSKQDCIDGLGEGNYLCDLAQGTECGNQGKKTCFIVGPYGAGAIDNQVEEYQDKVLEAELVTGDMNNERFSKIMLQNIINEGTTEMVGLSQDVRDKYDTYLPMIIRTYKGPGGAVGMIANAIDFMIVTPPINTQEYLADLGSSLGFAKPAYAQGTGFTALKPLLPIWKAFLNISYLAFIIIFILIGFMVMFRAKINPQTVITVQSALPKIVVTLLLVTFSYAIAAFMIDFIYIALYTIVGVFQLGGLITNSNEVVDRLLRLNVFGLVFDGRDIFLFGTSKAIGGIVESLTHSELLGGFSEVIFFAIFAIVITFTLFRILFMLLMAYTNIILSVIFAPFQLLMNAIPGNNSLQSWLRNLLAHVAIFPIIGLMFLLIGVFLGAQTSACPSKENPWCVAKGIGYYQQIEDGSTIWTPPFMRVGTSGGEPGSNPMLAMIALGMIMMMPNIIGMVKKAMKVEGGFAAGVAGGIMAGPKLMAAVPTTGFNLATQMGYIGKKYRPPSGAQIPLAARQEAQRET